MKIHKNAALIEHLASSYALGTLRGGSRRRLEYLATQHTNIRLSLLDWQTRLGTLNELSTAAQPSPNVWKRISNLLPLNTPTLTRARSLFDDLQDTVAALRARVQWWQRASWGMALASSFLIAGGFNVIRMESQAPNQFVAVLTDEAATESVLVTFDAKTQKLNLKRLSAFREGDEKSLQLWAIDTSGKGSSKPESMGVLGADAVLRLAADNKKIAQIEKLPLLAVSLEPKGGVPSEGGPTGRVLFKGQLRPTNF
jgi:anti-sigma-K factor RskA